MRRRLGCWISWAFHLVWSTNACFLCNLDKTGLTAGDLGGFVERAALENWLGTPQLITAFI